MTHTDSNVIRDSGSLLGKLGQRVELKIGGSAEPGHGDPFVVYNPATEEPIAEVRAASPEQVHRAVAGARAALDQRELGSAEDRSQYLHRLADVITAHADDILATVIAEVGTPVSTARDLHLGTPVEILRWLADAALEDRTEYLGPNRGPGASEAAVYYRPIGVVAGITAYNYPVLFYAMKAGGALAAGCPIVLLPSPQAPLSTLQFAGFLEQAGVPERAVSILAGGVGTAQTLIGANQVAKVTFTGSVAAGTEVMKAAAAGIRDVVLELGGKSPAIILPSARLADIVRPLHYRYLRNAGQGCASPTRLLVHEDQMAEFAEISRSVYDGVITGDPWNPDTIVGPVISPQHRDRVLGYISGALADGGREVAKGHAADSGRGWYVTPTLIGGLGNEARINQEEVFGPVATVIAYRTVEEAVAIANASAYGLHAYVFGAFDEARALAQSFEAGSVTINGGGRVRPDAPNGGWKESGIGRERGEAGVRAYLESVAVQWPAAP
jgi:acyl-CoA reductase-like NAD-dependent aldehyde dehydrogenase